MIHFYDKMWYAWLSSKVGLMENYFVLPLKNNSLNHHKVSDIE